MSRSRLVRTLALERREALDGSAVAIQNGAYAEDLPAVIKSVEGELWKLREDKPAPGLRRGRKLVLIGFVGLLLFGGGAGALVIRAKSRKAAAAATAAKATPHQARGLTLAERRILFATGISQSLDLRLPCAGLLSIDVTTPEGTCLTVFLMPPEERQKMDARQTFAHVDGFDARVTSGSYQRSARLPPGQYRLVLLDEGVSGRTVEVKARLSELQ